MGGDARRRLDRKCVAAFLQGGVDVPLDDLAKHHSKVVGNPLHAQRPLLGTRDRQQIVDESVHAIHLTFDRGQVAIERFQVELGALRFRTAHPGSDELREGLERRERGSKLVRDDRQELLSLTLAREEIRDVVQRHDTGDDLPLRTTHRCGSDFQVATLTGIRPRYEELALAFLAPHGSIQRIASGGDGLARDEVSYVDSRAKLGQRLEDADPEYFSCSWIGLEPTVGPPNENAVAEGGEQMAMQILLGDSFRIEARVGDPDGGRGGEQVRDLDVVGLEGALQILAVDHERADELLFEEERKREQLREAFRLDQLMIADAAGRDVEHDVLARGAKLRAYFIHRQTLLGRVAFGEAVMCPYDEGVSVVIREKHRGRVRRDQIARRADRVPEPVIEVERPDHFVIGVM